MDTMVIDNYDENLQLHPHVEDILKELENSPHAHLRNRIEVSIISPKAIRSSRGGQAPNKQCDKFHDYIPFQRMGCMWPFTQLVIRPTGAVSLCCQDALGKYTLGNAREMTLDDIWYGTKFAEVRRQLIEKGRGVLPLCNHCDMSPITRAGARATVLNFIPRREDQRWHLSRRASPFT